MSLENKLNGARELIENFQTHNYRLNVLPSKWDILKKSSDSINCIGSIGAAKFDFDKLYEKYKQNNYDSNAEIERDFNRLKNYARSYFGGFWSLVANTLEVLALTQFPEEKLFKKHKDGRKTLKGKKFKKLLEKNNKELYDILYQESDFKRNLRHPLSHWSEKDIIKDNGEKPKKESKFNISYENYLKNRTNIFEYDMDFFNKKSLSHWSEKDIIKDRGGKPESKYNISEKNYLADKKNFFDYKIDFFDEKNYLKMLPKNIKDSYALFLKTDDFRGFRIMIVEDLNGNKYNMQDIMSSNGLNSIEKIIKVYQELNK